MSDAIDINKNGRLPSEPQSLLRQLMAVRPIDAVPAAKGRLKQVLTVPALTAIGLGATIGTGIFVFTGQVAALHSGPAVTISLLIAATMSTAGRLNRAPVDSMCPSGKPASGAFTRAPGKWMFAPPSRLST